MLILFEDIQQNSTSFCIIADEVTGKYDNKEILSICVCFIEVENISEVFLDFVETTGAHIAEAIMLKTKYIYSYADDGAAAMSSERAGVQARMKIAAA